MSYIVLARKYRPQTFDQIVGQAHITRTLQNALISGRISHAYLFCGTRGVGKTSAARILAKALNCAQGPTSTPCGECSSCKSIAAGNSVDVFEIDGASNTGVDDVRQLRENVKYAPSSGRYKVYIIDEVHMLSTNAFNALLKTLEEPPPHVVFIFATTDPHKIPDTILSRCQTYEFKLIPLTLLLDTLKSICASEGIQMAEELLMLIARKAEGSMRDGLSFLDQTISFGADKITREELIELLGVIDRAFLIGLVETILDSDVPGVLERFEATAEFRFEPRQFYQDLVELLRDLIVVKVSKNPGRLVVAPDSELKQLGEICRSQSFETLQRQFDGLIQAENEVLRASHPRLVLEMLLVKMAHDQPIVPLDGLIAKLDELIANGAIAPGGGQAGPKPTPQRAAGSASPRPRSAKAAPQAVSRDEAPAQTQAANESADPQWLKLVEATKGKRLSAGALLDNGVPQQLSADLVRIGMNPTHLSLLGRAEDNEALLDAVAEVFGADARLELIALDNGSSQQQARSSKKKESDKLRTIKRQALESPVVKDALELFNGEVVDIRIQRQRK
ncbi:MAG: DNA polymerase III subunit gamma/tau [Candidatus Alcyoniella australis]|nr:DNA polymerase III subunit gamma/tau [Candidatus Alcyoniella australis]